MRIICCKFGDKFTDWHVDNLKHMIDTYSGLEYDSFEVIEDNPYNNVFNKLQMYSKFKDGQNLYFDLDVVIFNKLPNLARRYFTLLDDTWWREPAHTPLNSSIVSWEGDVSYIWNTFKFYEEENLEYYKRGSDEFYFEEINYYDTYEPVCPSIKDYIYKKPKDYSICTLGQMHHLMEKGWSGWYSDYFISR